MACLTRQDVRLAILEKSAMYLRMATGEADLDGNTLHVPHFRENGLTVILFMDLEHGHSLDGTRHDGRVTAL